MNTNNKHLAYPQDSTGNRARRSDSLPTEHTMNGKGILIAVALLFLILALAFPGAVNAQDPQGEGQGGVVQGNYNVKQTVEFGGRLTAVNGNRSARRTFSNYDEGINLFEYSLDMRSINHLGLFWDNLSVNSFGYGSDPQYVTRLRAYKNKWYNLGFTYRRDKNFWDYNLLANPINPDVVIADAPAGFSTVITESPHRMQTVRRLYDYNLTLLPQSPIRVRLGYNRNIHEGPSFSSFHEGTDVLIAQPWKTTLNSYQFGVDFRVLPRTSFSFDQFWNYYKGDTSWALASTAFSLPTGVLADGTPFTPVDLGIPFGNGQPCATPFLPGGVVNPTCQAYQQYARVAPVRTSYPSSRIAFQSNYFRNLDFAGSFAYSATDGEVPLFNEFFNGLVSRTRQRQFSILGSSAARRVSSSADFGITWHVNENLSVQDSFTFQNFRVPGMWAMEECSYFQTSLAATATTFAFTGTLPANCPMLTGGTVGTPSHASSSPADALREVFNNFLGEDSKTNTFMVRYDFNRHIGARIGYRFRTRDIGHVHGETADERYFPSLPNRGNCAGQPLLADGSCQVTTSSLEDEPVEINEHSALFGLWARPNSQFRASFDMELLSADGSYTRISPRQMQRYKMRVNYQPVASTTIAGSVTLNEARNNIVDVFHKRHNRTYGFSVVTMPNDRFALDFGYDYTDIFSQTNICYTIGSTPPPPGSGPCPTSGGLISGISLYDDKEHFVHFDVMWRPVTRLETRVGYAITSTNGQATFLQPNVPLGPLDLVYHLPSVSVAYDLSKRWTAKAGWNYYDYDENSVPDPTGPRSFRANLVNLSLRYAF